MLERLLLLYIVIAAGCPFELGWKVQSGNHPAAAGPAIAAATIAATAIAAAAFLALQHELTESSMKKPDANLKLNVAAAVHWQGARAANS